MESSLWCDQFSQSLCSHSDTGLGIYRGVRSKHIEINKQMSLLLHRPGKVYVSQLQPECYITLELRELKWLASVSGRYFNMHINQVRMRENRARTLATNRQTGPTGGVVLLKLCTKMRPRNNNTTMDKKEKMAHTQAVVNATCLQVWQLSLLSREAAEETAGRVSVFGAFTCLFSGSASVTEVLSGRLCTRYSGTGVRCRHIGQPILHPRPSRECRASRHSLQKVWEQTSNLGVWRPKSK